MNTIRVRRQIDSDTLHVPELQELMGKTVEITIREEPSAAVPPRAADFFLALAPERPSLDPKEIETLRADTRYKRFWPLLDIAGEDMFDTEAIAKLRAASMI